MVLMSAPGSVSTTSQSVATADEGYESKFMGATKPKQMTALMLLMRTLGLKIAQTLQKEGLPPRFAQAMGMQQAKALLKQMSMLSKNEMDFGQDAKEALSQNSILLTISLLLAKRGVQLEQFNFPQLMEESPQSGVFSDETLGKLTEMMEKLAQTDPALQQLVVNFKNLINKKASSPAEFSFEILQLFASALEMGKADLSSLDDLFGGGEELSSPSIGLLDGDFGELVDEYFLRGSSGGFSDVHSQV
jgi:hypothetical protein